MEINDDKKSVNPVETSTLPVPQPINNQRRNFLIILSVLFLLIVVGIGAYYLGTQDNRQITSIQNTPIPTNAVSNTPTQAQEAELKTFTSTPLRFTVKYPSEWITIEQTDEVYFSPKRDTANKDGGLVMVRVENVKEDMTLDSYIDNNICHAGTDCNLAKDAESITVSGIPGKKFLSPGPVPSNTVVVMEGNKVYILRLALDKSFEEMYTTSEKEKIFNRMVSSFITTN
jgi:hypothetical protein